MVLSCALYMGGVGGAAVYSRVNELWNTARGRKLGTVKGFSPEINL